MSLGSFVPPVVFIVEAKAEKAIASFRQINHELSLMETKALAAGKSVNRFNQMALVGTKVLKGFAIAMVAASAIGVKAIMDIEKSYTALGKAMANQGLASEANLKATSELVDSYEDLGFGSEKAADAYKVLITATGNMADSNRMLKISADLARAGNMSMEDAARSLIRAQAGNIKLFTQYGIELDKTKPKAEAVASAMGQLEQKLSGQAAAYAKTFAGQIAILKENMGDLFEAIGMKVLPVLNTFITKLNGANKFVKDHSDEIIGLALAITVALIPAFINLTKSIIASSVALLKSPWARAAVLIGGVAVALVKAYNASEGFRKGIAEVGKFVVTVGQVMFEVFATVANGILLMSRAGANARIALGKLLNKEDWVKQGKEALAEIDKVNEGYSKTIKKFEDAKKTIDDASKKKIKINIDFGIPQIPKFEDLFGKDGGGAKGLSDAFIAATQKIKDFNQALKDTKKEIAGIVSSLTNKDFRQAIAEGLLSPAEQLVLKTTRGIDAYQSAVGEYDAALANLTKAQIAYAKAVDSTDKKLQASAASALKRAEDAINAVNNKIKGSLSDLVSAQDEMISSVVSMTQQIEQLQKDRAKAIADGQKQERELTKSHLKNLAQLQKDYEKNVNDARKTAAERSAEIVKQSVDQLRNIYKSATAVSIGDMFQSMTFGGLYSKGGSVTKMIDALGLKLSKAKTLAEDAAALSGKGFSQTFIEQVVAQGPDVGHKLAQNILTATPESVKKLQDYWSQLDAQSSHGVDSLATTINSGMVLATEELTAQLAQVQKDLNTQLAMYAEELTAATTSAMEEYKSALDEIRSATRAIVAEIDAQIAQLQASINQLMAALAELAAAMAMAQNARPVTSNIIPIPLASEPSYNYGQFRKGEEESMRLYNEMMNKQNLTNVTINAQTNASPQAIANDVGWAIRTSGDVSFTSVGAYDRI